MTRIAMIISTFFIPGVAAAHPEHASGGGHGLAHFLADPFHMGLVAAIGLILFGVRRSMLRRQSLSPVRHSLLG
jgi:hypothetical protein